MIPTAKDLDADFLKHFADTNPVKSDSPTDTTERPNISQQFEPIRNFWLTRSNETIKAYDFGSNSGKFAANTSQLRIEDIFDALFAAIKNSVLNEIQQSGSEPYSFKVTFDALSSILDILTDKIRSTENSSTRVNAERILAAIHGHLNSYIRSFYTNNKGNEIYKL